VYVGGVPVAAGFVASQTEFDLWALVLSVVRWRRANGRFLPGCGCVTGYVVVNDEQHDSEESQLGLLDTEGLWGGS
jgi:hypothetical protein